MTVKIHKTIHECMICGKRTWLPWPINGVDCIYIETINGVEIVWFQTYHSKCAKKMAVGNKKDD